MNDKEVEKLRGEIQFLRRRLSALEDALEGLMGALEANKVLNKAALFAAAPAQSEDAVVKTTEIRVAGKDPVDVRDIGGLIGATVEAGGGISKSTMMFVHKLLTKTRLGDTILGENFWTIDVGAKPGEEEGTVTIAPAILSSPLVGLVDLKAEGDSFCASTKYMTREISATEPTELEAVARLALRIEQMGRN